MKKYQIRNMVIAAMLIALCVVLPIAFHSIPDGGSIFLPMHIPVLICGMMVLPVIYSSVSTGIHLTDPQLLEMAKVYRLSKLRIFRRIYVPSVMPFFRMACSIS